jgi:carbon-monoxide dehydrogenase medium subunit
MVAAPFDYAAASSYDEAVRLLAEGGEEAKIIAGGQSLVPMLNLRLARPELLIDINGVGCREPEASDGVLRLGALTRHRTILEHPVVRAHCPLLASAVRHVGNVRVRNRGTIGGSLAHAEPTSEIGCCCVALDARVVAQGPGGTRTIGARELFAGYLATTLAPAEVITEVLIPVTGPAEGWSFQEIARRTSDFAVVAVAARIALDDEARTISRVDLALAGVADRVQLAEAGTVEILTGEQPGYSVIEQAARALEESVDPPADVHASSEYRRRLVRVLAARALREAAGRARRAAT